MKIDRLERLATTGALCAAALLSACGGGERKEADESGTAGQPTPAATATPPAGGAAFSADQLTPESGRKVVTVQLETDEQGNNKFTPNDFEVHKGDVIRYTLKSGVHNVHFVADSNRNATGLPTQPSDLLQLPGQTIDLKVAAPKGKYYFQCDPHAALGMVAHMEVED
jgi:plastocyanin